jgi:voltage-gated potassium channel
VEKQISFGRITRAVAAVAIFLTGGTIGFHAVLEESWLQSFYRAVVTMSLTGLDTVPPNDGSRVLSIVLVFAGLTIFAYVAAMLVEAIAHGVVSGALADRRRRLAIERLHDHYIICGYGRVGRSVGLEFREAGVPYVVVDFSPDALEVARERGELLIAGNGTEDEDLEAAGLERARGLVASSDSDSDNLYITLSARAARPDLVIVARASDGDAAQKLRLAGADRVVQPYSTAGKELAGLALKPQVAAFLDVVSSAGGPEFRFEEIEVTEECGQTGKSIRDLRVRERTGAMIVAIRKREGTFDVTPEPEAVFEDGDVLIAAGTPAELASLEDMFARRGAVAH